MDHHTAFVQKAVKNIGSLAITSQRLKAAPSVNAGGGVTAWYNRMDELFNRLKSGSIVMTPSLAKATNIDEGLRKVYSEKYFFPTEYQSRAQALHKRFIREGWGAGADELRGNGNEKAGKSNAAARSTASKIEKEDLPTMDRDIIRIPPADHPIYGVNGIMHGVAIKDKCRQDQKVKSSNVFGHNGLEIGAWFPRKFAAKFHGAHGTPFAGICGDGANGAYAIVVSAEYDDLDADQGDTLYYSGSHSHDNEDPNNAPERSSGTQALYKSSESGNEVRVLRASGAKARYAPTRGLRYDGLYCVVRDRQKTNKRGGLYDQFELTRVPGQKPLDEYHAFVPNPVQADDFDNIRHTRIGSWDIVDAD